MYYSYENIKAYFGYFLMYNISLDTVRKIIMLPLLEMEWVIVSIGSFGPMLDPGLTL